MNVSGSDNVFLLMSLTLASLALSRSLPPNRLTHPTHDSLCCRGKLHIVWDRLVPRLDLLLRVHRHVHVLLRPLADLRLGHPALRPVSRPARRSRPTSHTSGSTPVGCASIAMNAS